jgi:hypothetical protein
LILELNRTGIAECGVEPACIVDFVDETRKIGCDILERFVGQTASTFNVFMKLSASENAAAN